MSDPADHERAHHTSRAGAAARLAQARRRRRAASRTLTTLGAVAGLLAMAAIAWALGEHPIAAVAGLVAGAIGGWLVGLFDLGRLMGGLTYAAAMLLGGGQLIAFGALELGDGLVGEGIARPLALAAALAAIPLIGAGFGSANDRLAERTPSD